MKTKNEDPKPTPALPLPVAASDVEAAVLQLVDRVINRFFVDPKLDGVREQVFAGRLPKPEFEEIFIGSLTKLVTQPLDESSERWGCPGRWREVVLRESSKKRDLDVAGRTMDELIDELGAEERRRGQRVPRGWRIRIDVCLCQSSLMR